MGRYLVFAFSIQTLTAPDHWLSADKAQHFFLAAFIQSASFGVARATGAGKTPSLMGASAVSLSAVVAKEVRDRNGRGTPSVKDAVWGLAGAAAISPLLARTK
jgi:uncharacterized protein YfiM (DUF2279 family)